MIDGEKLIEWVKKEFAHIYETNKVIISYVPIDPEYLIEKIQSLMFDTIIEEDLAGKSKLLDKVFNVLFNSKILDLPNIKTQFIDTYNDFNDGTRKILFKLNDEILRVNIDNPEIVLYEIAAIIFGEIFKELSINAYENPLGRPSYKVQHYLDSLNSMKKAEIFHKTPEEIKNSKNKFDKKILNKLANYFRSGEL